jgi:MFS family permease
MTRVGRAARETFRSMSVRNFRLFFTGQLISQVGNWLTLVAQALFVLKLTDNGVWLGVLAAVQFGPVLVIGPWAGLVADRADKRRLLLIVQTIAMLQSFTLAALAFSGNPPVAAIFAVALIGGITVAFDNPARRAFVVEMVPEEDVHNAVSLNSALMTSSRIIGPALAGLLIVVSGFGWCFLLDGLSYTAVLAALWMMRTDELRPSVPTPRGKGQVREGFRYVRGVPELWVPLVMMAVIGTLSYNFQTVFPLFAIRDLHGSDTTFTLLFSVVSVGALMGALAVARRRSISVRTVSRSAVAYGIAMALMAFAPNATVAFVLAPALGMASIAFLTASTAIVQTESAPQMRGRVLALQAMLFLGSTPIGGPIVGWVSQTLGARFGIALGAAAALLSGAWGLAAGRSMPVFAAHPAPSGAQDVVAADGSAEQAAMAGAG